MFAGRPPCSLGFKPFEGSSTTEGSEGESNSLLPSVFIQSKIAEMITFYDIKNKECVLVHLHAVAAKTDPYRHTAMTPGLRERASDVTAWSTWFDTLSCAPPS